MILSSQPLQSRTSGKLFRHSPQPSLLLCLILVFSHLSAFAESDESSYFGVENKVDGALIGILYDIKQNQQREPTKPAGNYKMIWDNAVTDFINSSWDESVLTPFYRVTKALYSQVIYFPTMKADAAPKAFGVADLVEPTYWLVHYKGQIRAPSAGTYRFVGNSDNILAVAINQKTVLVAPHGNNPLRNIEWKSTEPKRDKGIYTGDWFKVQEGDILDLDILIGERPGGGFYARLWWEKQGVEYEKDREGHSILPYFRMSEKSLPESFRDSFPRTEGSPWLGVQ